VASGKNKLLVILLSLVVATVVSAAPTMYDCNKNCDCKRNFVTAAVSPASDAHVTYVPETSQINVPSNSHLAAIGKEILKPPADFTDSPPLGTETLHPHAAVFMVLTGFLCVSLVKDRKVWLAALVGLLWAGQAGFHAIPQLAAHISKNVKRKSYFNTAALHQLEESCRLRSDIEGTQYIGLLHHLAGIPAGTISLPLPTFLTSLRAPFLSLRAQRSNLNTSREYFVFARTTSNAASPQFAITHFSSLLNSATICPAPRAGQYICFSPAFVFQQLPRGPPNSA
jgi:hypothetical protein